jgi:hypothetical protein
MLMTKISNSCGNNKTFVDFQDIALHADSEFLCREEEDDENDADNPLGNDDIQNNR